MLIAGSVDLDEALVQLATVRPIFHSGVIFSSPSPGWCNNATLTCG